MPAQTIKPPVAVTGGAAGIGYAMARAFGEVGYPIALIDIDGSKAERSAAAIAAETGVKAFGVGADVADSTACPSSLSHPGPDESFTACDIALFTKKEEKGVFPDSAFGSVCLQSATLLAPHDVPARPRRSRWCLHSHTRNLKRNPVVFRPRAARTDDGARRPWETPRSSRCRRTEPIAPWGYPC
jgi:hypothetical protein